jgi:hypothetical protein
MGERLVETLLHRGYRFGADGPAMAVPRGIYGQSPSTGLHALPTAGKGGTARREVLRWLQQQKSIETYFARALFSFAKATEDKQRPGCPPLPARTNMYFYQTNPIYFD